MSFASIFLAMAKLFLILLVGFVCQKAGVFPEDTQNVLNKLVIYIANPCTIAYSAMSGTQLPGPQLMLELIGIALVTYGALILLGWVVVRAMGIQPGSQGVYLCMLLFSNCGFIGLPVVQTIFGSTAVFYSAIFNLPFNPLMFTLGAWLMMRDGAAMGHGQKKLKMNASVILNPNLVASAIAIVLALTGSAFVPEAISGTIGTLGNLTTPAALLVIGISLAKQPVKSMLGSPRIYFITFLRLVAVPALAWLGLRCFVSDPLVLGVAVVMLGMPVAAMVPIMANECGGDEKSGLQGVFLSTVLSMVTIPLLVMILC